MYRLTIHHDDMPENPNDEDTLFHVHSFSTRHINFTDPDKLLACEYEFPEGHEDEGFTCDEMPTSHGEGRIEDHDWIGPKGFFLSYFEHGLCRWGLEGTMSGMPDFRWDGVQFAGWLEVKEDNDWFLEKSEEEQHQIAASYMDYYTDWCNGEVYGYTLEQFGEVTCDQDEVHEVAEKELDSCWGFVGAEHLVEEVKEVLKHYEIKPHELEVVDEAYGASDYMEFFERAA